MVRNLLLILVCLAASAGAASQSNAGPPFRTDDPSPTETGHFEFYVLSSGTARSSISTGYLPGIELDYGLIPNGQLTIDAGFSFATPSTGGGTDYGPGDSSISFKYRFIQEDSEGWRPQVATFPAINLPTGNEARGLGAGHPSYFLPLWAQKSFGDWTTYGGGGYWFNEDKASGDKNYWFFGWLLQRQITKKLVIGGEAFYQTAPNVADKDSIGFNIGGIYNFDDHNHFVMSVGRGLENATAANELSWYIAWKFTW